MKLPEFGVKRPVTNLMIFLGIIILSVYSLSRIGIDSFPKIEPPSITVISNYSGANPSDVEIKVTEPLENQLATLPGLEKITSRSLEGTSFITLKFIWGTNLDEATNDIRDRIELAKRFLPDIPDEMDNPFIFKFNTTNIPILFLGVTAKESYPDLRDMIDKRVGDVLRQLPGVGTVQIEGGLERQINIWIGRQRLEGYGFSILDIQEVLRRENISQPVGNLKSGLTDYLLRIPGEFRSPDEIKLVILGKRDGKSVYLKDVARIEDSFKEVLTSVKINGKLGILLNIQKQTDTNTVEVAERVKEKLKELQGLLPQDVKLNIIFDNSQDIIDSLDSLKNTLWAGIVLVIFVVWFFLRQLKPSLIIALTIPFSLLVAFIYMFLSGKTINSISLSSLAIASGMVVDAAIVIVDNVYRRLERGNRPQEAAIFGTQEMFLAISATVFTTVVVFLPMLFIPGVIGIMFGELAVIVTVTLTASLFTASTFTPMLCAKWMRNSPPSKRFAKFYEFSEKLFSSWENFYSRRLTWCLKHKKLVVFGFSVVFILSLFLVPFVGTEFMPTEDSGDLRITAEFPVGTRLEETQALATRIEEIYKSDVPEARIYYVRSGTVSGVGRAFNASAGTHVVISGAKLISKTKRKKSVEEIGQIIRSKIRAIPGIIRTDVSTGNPIGRLITGQGGKPVQIEVIGNSFDDTDAVAKELKEAMEKIPGAVDVTISRQLTRPEIRIEVDREKAGILGIDMNTVAASLRTYIEGQSATKYREKGKTYDIYVRLEEKSRQKIEDVQSLSIVSPFSKQQVKLSNIAKIEETFGPLAIERQNRERVVRVECNTFRRASGKVVEDLRKALTKISLPADVMVNIGGEAQEQKKAFKDLFLLLLLGICLVYMVMAAQFESLYDPFIVMFSVPFTFTGVIWAFLITRTTLSVVTYLGVVMLMGIVVDNAIVLISYIILLRQRGSSLIEAITTGGKERLRPVLMTTITTLAGLIPLALSRTEGSEVWQPLGITMVGGLLVSTFVTMLFVPTLYAIFETRLKRKKVAHE
ncbi:MAG: efflux RND transporter permease subunit [Candidatus Omnitrophota bacterium]